MSRFSLLLAALGFASAVRAVEIGQTWAEVESELGKPASQLEAGGRRIGRWAEVEVIFDEGKVKSFLRRDLAAEAASEERRRQEAEIVRKLREEAELDNRRREEERRAQEERERPERERKAQAEKIAALEAQLEIERKALRDMTEQVNADRAETRTAGAVTLRQEIAVLRLEIQRALGAGETDRAARLRGLLIAKDRELGLLTRQSR